VTCPAVLGIYSEKYSGFHDILLLVDYIKNRYDHENWSAYLVSDRLWRNYFNMIVKTIFGRNKLPDAYHFKLLVFVIR